MFRTAIRIYLRYKRVQRRVRGKPEVVANGAWLHAHERSAEELYQLAVGLKGLLIKVGQFAGTRADIAPPPYVRSLSRLQDAVPPRPMDEVRGVVESGLGARLEELFATFDEQPIAAASLAQVHRATLKDGRRVAVKVQYPEVGELVTLDLRNLRLLARLVAWREPGFDYRAIVDELERELPKEVDFVREAEMTRQVGKNLAAVAGVVVPGVVDGMVARRVLVTEFLVGEKLVGPRSAELSAQGRSELARLMADAYGRQILLDGLFQADPHPGNLLLLEDGRIGLVDFGLTKALPERVRLGFARLVVGVAERNPATVMAAFGELNVGMGSDNPQDLLTLSQLFFETREGQPGSALQRERTEALNRSPVKALPGDLVLLGRVVGLLRGICASLDVDLSPSAMLLPFAREALAAAAPDRQAAAQAGS